MKSGIAGPWGGLITAFLRNHCTNFNSDCTSFTHTSNGWVPLLLYISLAWGYFLQIHLEVEFHGRIKASGLNFWGTSRHFFFLWNVFYPFVFTTAVTRFPISTYSSQTSYLFFCLFVCFNHRIGGGMKWFLLVIFIFIFLMTSGVEYLYKVFGLLFHFLWENPP